jgi:hypothetical protein
MVGRYSKVYQAYNEVSLWNLFHIINCKICLVDIREENSISNLWWSELFIEFYNWRGSETIEENIAALLMLIVMNIAAG